MNNWGIRLASHFLILLAAVQAEEFRAVVPAGGWEVDHRRYALTYKPARHADRFVTAWLNLSVEHREGQRLRREWSEVSSVKNCLSCHSSSAQTGLAIHWKAADAGSRRPLYRFNHRVHVMPGDGHNACAACHSMAPTAAAQQFVPLTKDTCSNCHNATSASQRCSLCHEYHAGNMLIQ